MAESNPVYRPRICPSASRATLGLCHHHRIRAGGMNTIYIQYYIHLFRRHGYRYSIFLPLDMILYLLRPLNYIQLPRGEVCFGGHSNGARWATSLRRRRPSWRRSGRWRPRRRRRRPLQLRPLVWRESASWWALQRRCYCWRARRLAGPCAAAQLSCSPALATLLLAGVLAFSNFAASLSHSLQLQSSLG